MNSVNVTQKSKAALSGYRTRICRCLTSQNAWPVTDVSIVNSVATKVYRATPCVPICARFLNTANTRFAGFHQQDEIGSMEVLAFAMANVYCLTLSSWNETCTPSVSA